MKDSVIGAVDEIRRGIVNREKMIGQVSSYEEYAAFCNVTGEGNVLSKQEFESKTNNFFKDSHRLLDIVEELESRDFIALIMAIEVGCLNIGPEFISKVGKLVSLLVLREE